MQTVHREDSYYEEYKRSQPSRGKKKDGDGANGSTNQQLLTDRNAYMAFLEVELERVSSACLTVQSYQQRLSALDGHQRDADEKLQRFSRALQLSTAMAERVESESRHKAENVAARLSAMEKRQTAMESDCALFVNGDLPSLREEVRQTVKRQLVAMTAKYTDVERRCEELIHQRLDGYSEVYAALETKLQRALSESLSQFAAKASADADALKDWTRAQLAQHLERVRGVEQSVTQRIETLQRQILEEQPQYLEGVLTKKLRAAAKDTADIEGRVDAKLNAQRQAAERAELTCAKIADDVYGRLQSQRSDLFAHIKSVEGRIAEELKDAIAHICDSRAESATPQLPRKRSRSIGAAAVTEHDRQSESQNSVSAMRRQMCDYRSEMIHSQHKLSELEQQMKFRKATATEDRVIPSSATKQGLAELDRKYSSIQSSISGLQAMMSEHAAPRRKRDKKKPKHKKKNAKRRAKSMVGRAQPQQCVPSHLTPHLSDLDNLVQSVFEADQLDRRHTAKLCKKRKSQTALLRASCPSRPNSAPKKKKGGQWK